MYGSVGEHIALRYRFRSILADACLDPAGCSAVEDLQVSAGADCRSRKLRWGREEPGSVIAAFLNQAILRATWESNSSLRLCPTIVRSFLGDTSAVHWQRGVRELCGPAGRAFPVFRRPAARSDGTGHQLPVSRQSVPVR
jgi:hypothetical protein